MLSRIHDLFNNKEIRETLVKHREAIALVALIMITPFIDRSLFFAGLTVSLFGQLIQMWCFASLKKQRTLAAKGLYSVVRNPMYLGRYFIILGGFILVGNILLILLYTAAYYFYMVNRVEREEKTLQEIFGEDYSNYCRNVNRFIPTFKHFNKADFLFFRWELFLRNHGPANLTGLVAVYLILYYLTFVHNL